MKPEPISKVFGHRDLVVDSTGLKVYGEGEWKVRAHGASKRRTWRKLHLAVDPSRHEVLAHVLTENDKSDDEVFPELLGAIVGEIGDCAGDGAYDKRGCFEACHSAGQGSSLRPTAASSCRNRERKRRGLPSATSASTASTL